MPSASHFLFATVLILISGMVCASAQPRLIAWGDFSVGTNVPVGLPDLKSISAGFSHGLALRSNGLVVAWGDNSLGQASVPSNLSNVTAVAAGQYHSLALRSNGTVVAWGLNNFGQSTVPTSLTNIIAIAAGSLHSLALRSNGTVVVWGGNDPVIRNVPAGLNNVAAISAGDAHSLVLRSNGTLVAWGNNDSGQTNLPTALGLTNIAAICAGYHHNLAVRSNGTVVAWDANAVNVYGESTVPAGLSNVTRVAAGYFYSMALHRDGTVTAWGQDFTGLTNVPPGLTNAVAISTGTAAGSDFALALTPSLLCPPGFPDNFECRQVLSGTNISFSASNVGATSEPGEPSHFDFDAGKSLWYTWTAPASGGVVLSAQANFNAPLLAVYAGSNYPSLTELGANNATYFQSRVVFTAVAGTAYQIVVGGTTANGSTGEGNLNVTLTLNPPPANNLFVNSTVISNTFYETAGSFVGASEETGEPIHTNLNGNATFHQTLWWTWTAPTNVGITSIPVNLTADGVSFPPNVGLYTGASLNTLVRVPNVVSQTNGMTRKVSFTATAGTVYQIALGGLQADPFGVDASPRIGNFRLRLSITPLLLTFSGINLVNNADDSIAFSANAQVTNYGSAASGPLRVQIVANSGVSVRGPDNGFATNKPLVLTVTNFAALAPGQGTVRRVSGTIPAPAVNPGATPTNGIGYGAYGNLQEQVDTNYFTVDQTLLAFGVWPDLGGFLGPGGGVIRLDPGLTGAGFNPLVSVGIFGATTLPEGSTAIYFGRAKYANNYQYDFTNTTWSSTVFTITNGIFTVGSVDNDTLATLTATYSSGGISYKATTNILILNVPPANLSQPTLQLNTNFVFSLEGAPNRKYVIEVTSDLRDPVIWLPASTNTIPASGSLSITNSLGSDAARFFRAREAN